MKTGKEVDMGGTFDWFGEESLSVCKVASYEGIDLDAPFALRPDGVDLDLKSVVLDAKHRA